MFKLYGLMPSSFNIILFNILTYWTNPPNKSKKSKTFDIPFDSVSAAEIARRVAAVNKYFRSYLDPIAIFIVSFMFALFVIVLIISAAVQSKTGKKVGLAGILMVLGGMVLYFLTPLIIGIVLRASLILNGQVSP